MTVDLEAFGLPFIPGTDTDLYELPDDHAERILRYLRALFAAKTAGVLGQEIRYPQAYVDRVVRQRVADAKAGGKAWIDRSAEMDRDEAAWKLRAADHAARAIGRNVASSGQSRAEGALALAKRAEMLDEATVVRLGERDLDVMVKDANRTQELTLSRIDPQKASLHGRTLRRLESTWPTFERARAMFKHLPYGAYSAAIALSAWDELNLAERAVLYGAWAEVVDGDPSIVEGAWTEAADRMREQWVDLPADAFGWSPDREDISTPGL